MMNKMVIGITGAAGFIGSAIAASLEEKDFTIVRISKDRLENANSRSFDLEHPETERLLEGIEILIHCALYKNERASYAADVNYHGTKELIYASRKQGVRKFIFVSSVSSQNPVSSYGRMKWQIHSLLDPQKDLVMRCGLVVGNGGLFGGMLSQALRKRIVPVLQRGDQAMQLIAIDDLINFIYTAISENLNGDVVVANQERLNYSEVFRTISKVYNRKLLFVPVPVSLLQAVLAAAKWIGLKLPVNIDNIKGLTNLQYQSPFPLLSYTMTLEEKLTAMKKASSIERKVV